MQKDSKKPQNGSRKASDLLAAWAKVEPEECRANRTRIPGYWVREIDCERWNFVSDNFVECQWRVVVANVFDICQKRGWAIALSCQGSSYKADVRLIVDFFNATASSQLEASPGEALLAAYLAALETEKICKEELESALEIPINPQSAAAKQAASSGDPERDLPQTKILLLVERRDRATP